MPLIDRLRQRLQQRYPLKEQVIPLADGQIVMTVVREPDEWLEKLSREDSAGRLILPYWTYLWPSSIALAQHLNRMQNLQGKEVLELGCGFGLPGIAAFQRGAAVLFIDYERDALLFAQYNALQNGCSAGTAFVRMDWNCPCFNRPFSRIIAADIIYEEINWQPLLAFLQKHLTRGSLAIFAEPNRANTPGFLELLNQRGFTYEKHSHAVPHEGSSIAVDIYHISKADTTSQ
jgi:predicted nicotinamide N-methyase